jgi:hypothetical protein
MSGFRTALGIDICNGRINLALLKKHGDRVRLLKTASCPIPEGAIKGRNIENPAVLAGAIKKLKIKNGIHYHPTAISLIANPTLMQILDLPKDAPGNVRRFVFNEVKHYAVLPIKKAAVDFCGVKSSIKSNNRRALVIATEGQKIKTAAKTLNRRGLNIELIEPAWMAYIRACYTRKISGKTGTNLLFAMIFDGILTLSLFRDNALDFIRVKPVELSRPEDCSEWVAEEISQVLKFYRLRNSGKDNKWQITLITDIFDAKDEKTEELLKDKLGDIELDIINPEDAYLDTPVADDALDNKPSAVAVGLAMGLLNTPNTGLNINMLPPEVAAAKSREQKILALLNFFAAFLVIMIIGSYIINAEMEDRSAAIERKKQLQVSIDTQELLNEQSNLQQQFEQVSTKLEQINKTIKTDTVLKWGPILEEIRLVTPETVRITELDSKENSEILLNGQAVSYPAVNLFIEALNTCKNIESASLIVSKSNRQSNGLVEYSISCLLTR